MTYGVNIGYKGCCGFVEIYDFEEDDNAEYMPASGDTFEELLATIKDRYREGQVFHIWFAKEPDYNGRFTGQQYGWNGLRRLVQKIPDVIHIGKFINPNSNNMIDGYAWVNKKG